MQPHDLIELLRRLHGEAESVLEGSACARLLEKEEESAKQRYQRAKGTLQGSSNSILAGAD